jgi:hypothetical protein
MAGCALSTLRARRAFLERASWRHQRARPVSATSYRRSSGIATDTHSLALQRLRGTGGRGENIVCDKKAKLIIFPSFGIAANAEIIVTLLYQLVRILGWTALSCTACANLHATWLAQTSTIVEMACIDTQTSLSAFGETVLRGRISRASFY